MSVATGAAVSSVPPGAAGGRLAGRIGSLDLVRGVVMVLMAIDHVRVYAGVPAGGPAPGVFFTRWITHFAAPAFAFLAGTGAYLHAKRLGSQTAIARYLATRGIWLVLLELTVIRIAWTFNFDFSHYLLAGVIWMLGWCMILLAVLVRLPTAAVGAFGLTVILGHNLLDRLSPALLSALQQGSWSWLWQILYFGGPIRLGHDGPTFMVLYSIFPWIGVMAAGYAFGAIMLLEPSRRNRLCVTIGGAAILLFLLLRGFNLYGDPLPWNPTPQGRVMPAAFRFLNTTKYPASLLFLLMTLGPIIALLPLAERARGRVAESVTTFGRVPLFYYLLHIPAIHLAAVVVSLVREGQVNAWLFDNHPAMVPPAPDGYRWSLALLYGVFVVVVAALYLPCRWFARLKARRKNSWLQYL